MRTKIVEAVQSLEFPGNWGKFMVGVPDEEWSYESRVAPGKPLLGPWGCGYSRDFVWVLDCQTGEGAFLRPGGSAHADLEKHRVWVCVLYEAFLEWLYAHCRDYGGVLDLDTLPDVVELPGVPFELAGYRRPGPQDAVLGEGNARE